MTADGPIHHKYGVWRMDGKDADVASKHFGGCNYFVLDIDHDPAARVALRAYAMAIDATHPVLAGELLDMVVDADVLNWRVEDHPPPPALETP